MIEAIISSLIIGAMLGGSIAYVALADRIATVSKSLERSERGRDAANRMLKQSREAGLYLKEENRHLRKSNAQYKLHRNLNVEANR